MASPSPTDILTLSELRDDALSSSSAVVDESAVTVRAIRDAQDTIRTYIGQDPMVHRLTQAVRGYEWSEDPTDPNDNVRAWADHQPIVEVETSDISIRHDDRQFLRSSRKNVQIDYFAGWKRRDQDLSDLQGELPDLDTEPENVPQDIRRTAVMLTLYYIGTSEHGAGIGQISHTVGASGSITVDGPDPSFERRQLKRISGYKNKVV